MWTFYTFPASRRLLCLSFVLFFIIFQRCNLLGLLIGFFSPAPLIAFLSRNIDFCSHCSQPLHLHLRFGSNQSSHVAAKHGMLSLMPKKREKVPRVGSTVASHRSLFFSIKKSNINERRLAARTIHGLRKMEIFRVKFKFHVLTKSPIDGVDVQGAVFLQQDNYTASGIRATPGVSTRLFFPFYLSFLFFFFKFYSCAVSRPRYREEHSLPASMREPSGAGRRRKKGEKKVWRTYKREEEVTRRVGGVKT